MSKKPRGSGPDRCPKAWEKARRDKIKGLFEELNRLLPQFDPTMQSSRVDVIQRAMSHIRELQAQNEDLLKGGFNEVYKNKIETWKRRVKELVCRVEQLTSILRTANIHIPPLALESAPMWTEKRPRLWTKKIIIPQDKIDAMIGTINQSKKRKSDDSEASNEKKGGKKKQKTSATKLKSAVKDGQVVKDKVIKQAIVRPLPKSTTGQDPRLINNQSTVTVPRTEPIISNPVQVCTAVSVQAASTTLSTTTITQSIATIHVPSQSVTTNVSNISAQVMPVPFQTQQPNAGIPVSILSAQPAAAQTNTYILTNQGNLLPILPPSASVLTPIIINRPPPVLVLQNPVSTHQAIISRPPANKRRIPRDSTVMTFTNNIPIPALSKHSHSRKGGKCGTSKGNSLMPVTSAPAVSPTAAFLNAFPVVTSSKSVGDEPIDASKKDKTSLEVNDTSQVLKEENTASIQENSKEERKLQKVDKASQATDENETTGVSDTILRAEEPQQVSKESTEDDASSKSTSTPTDVIAVEKNISLSEEKNMSPSSSSPVKSPIKQDETSKSNETVTSISNVSSESTLQNKPVIPENTEPRLDTNPSCLPAPIEQHTAKQNVSLIDIKTKDSLKITSQQTCSYSKNVSISNKSSDSTAIIEPVDSLTSKITSSTSQDGSAKFSTISSVTSTQIDSNKDKSFKPDYSSQITTTSSSCAVWPSVTTVTATVTTTSWYPNVDSSVPATFTTLVSSSQKTWLPIPAITSSENTPSTTKSASASVSASWRPISTDPLWTYGQTSGSDAWSFNVLPPQTSGQLPTPTFLEPLQQTVVSKPPTTVTSQPHLHTSVSSQIGLYPFANICSTPLTLPVSETNWSSNISRPLTNQKSIAPITSVAPSNSKVHTTFSVPVTPKAPSVSTYCAQQLIGESCNYSNSNLPQFRDVKYSSNNTSLSKNPQNTYSNISNLVADRNPVVSFKQLTFIESNTTNTISQVNQFAYQPPTTNVSKHNFFSNPTLQNQDDAKSFSNDTYKSRSSDSTQGDALYAAKCYPPSNIQKLNSDFPTPYSFNINDHAYITSYASTPNIHNPTMYSSSLTSSHASQPPKTYSSIVVSTGIESSTTTKIINQVAVVTTTTSKCGHLPFSAGSSTKKPYQAASFTETKSENDQSCVSSYSASKNPAVKNQINISDSKLSDGVPGLWNGPYFSNTVSTSDSSWSQLEYNTCTPEAKENRPKPPINWMTETEPRTDVLCPQEDPFQSRYQSSIDRKDSHNMFDFCLNAVAEEDVSKGKYRKKDSESGSQDYFSWFSMKIDPFVVPSTLPTLVGDLALGGDPVPSKRNKSTIPVGDNYPRPAKEAESGTVVPQEPFTNLSKNIFEFSQSDSSKCANPTETIVLKNIFELPTPTTSKQKNTPGPNSFLSVSQLVEPHSIDVNQKSDYSYYNQRPGKSKRTSGWKCNEKKYQVGVKSCSSYSTEALLKTAQDAIPVESDFPLANSTTFPMEFPTDPILMDQAELPMGQQVKAKTYNSRTRKQDCWNGQNTTAINFPVPATPSTLPQSFPIQGKQTVKTSENVVLPLPYLSDSRLPTPQPQNLHLSPCVSGTIPFPRFPGNPLPLPFSQHKTANETVPFTGIFPPPRTCVQPDGSFPPSGTRYPGPRKPFAYPRPGKVSFPPFSPSLSSDGNRKSVKPAVHLQQMSNPMLTSPLSVSRAYPPFPPIPTQPAGPSGSSLANFNLSTIFPEMNKKGNYQYP